MGFEGADIPSQGKGWHSHHLPIWGKLKLDSYLCLTQNTFQMEQKLNVKS